MTAPRWTIVAVEGMIEPDSNGLWMAHADHEAIIAAEARQFTDAALKYGADVREQTVNDCIAVVTEVLSGERDTAVRSKILEALNEMKVTLTDDRDRKPPHSWGG